MKIKNQLLNSVAFANGLNEPSQAVKNTMTVVPSGTLEKVLGSFVAGDIMLKRSDDSAAMLNYWDKTDAIVEGYETVKAAAETYLPKFPDETHSDYTLRLQSTKFTNVYRDIVEGLSTKPFEEEISLIEDEKSPLPEDVKNFCEDVDGSGNNLTVFSSLTFFNGINSAIDWIFIDYPKIDTNIIRTIADLKSSGIKPFWTHVLGRNVLEARVEMINGKETLSYIRIFEPGKPDHVRIFERQPNGAVNWQLWEKKDKTSQDGKTQFEMIDEDTLSINVIPLVPFITGRRDGRTFKVFPAMQDAADLQIELYQQESALKFIKILAAYPMLAANGMKPQMQSDGKTPKPLATGPMRVLWGIPDGAGNSGTWQFVEPSATSMTFLAADVKATIEQLRELGRQPLTAQSGNLTVITTAVAAGKSKSAVGAWALLLKDALERAFQITGMFAKWNVEPQVNVYNEFDEFTDDGKDVDALISARKNGDLSRNSLWKELKRRKILMPEFDAEKELEELLNEVPTTDENVDEEAEKPPVKKAA